MTENWTPTIEFEDVPQDDVVGVEIGGRTVALYRINEEIFATDGICSHGHARLCDGFVEGDEIECPLHQGRFNLKTGKALCAPLTEDIRTYVVKIEDGKVYVNLD